mgnify:CR=1 FL=1
MDDVDIANMRRDQELENRISDHMYRMNQSTVHYVDCVFCQGLTENGEKYCSKECRDDDERLISAKIRNGRA